MAGKRSIAGGWIRGVMAGLLALAMVLGTWTSALAADGDSQPGAEGAAAAGGPSRAQLDEALGALQTSLGRTAPLSDWVALGLARGGKPVGAPYLAQAGKNVADGKLRLVTDYARTALAVNANGGDVRRFGPGKSDLLAEIANYENMTAQGPNAPAYALLALDAGDYEPVVKDRWSRDSLLKWLVDNRNADGGWSLAPGKSDVDVTGIVLLALAPYQDREDVRAATEAALGWLSGVQRDNGGFGNPESSESSVQVLIALTSLGIDPVQDARFVKNGKSALSRLMEFRLGDGSFAHVPGGKSDGMSSLYAMLGLTAVERWMDGLPALYAGERAGQSVEITVYGTNFRLARENVNGRTALESLVQALRKNGLSYEIERHPQFGPFLKSISGVQNASFGGYDGWQYAVRRGDQWLTGLPGMAAFEPRGGDRIVVYYGGETDLIHSVKVEPAAPREGQPITVTVEKEKYDWDTGKTVVSPAEAARVTVGGQSAVTDKDGKVSFDRGLPIGLNTLTVDGYRAGSTPAYVTFESPLAVGSYVKTVTLRVEGDQGAIAAGTAQGGTALEALESFLKARNIGYQVEDSAYGKYVAAINGTAAGKYGGYDGWNFAVKSGNAWIVPGEGMGTYLLEDGQELVVYYGDMGTKLPEPAIVTPAAPKPGETVAVAVTYREMDWDAGKLKDPAPLAGVRVSAGSASAVTDENGIAKLAGLPVGAYRLEVSGYAAGKAPVAVRTVTPLAVVGDYADQAKVSGWAADSVRIAKASGVLRGPGDSAAGAFDPKTAVTRAEFVASLVRALGLAPQSGSDFKDVPAAAWYAKEIQAASKAGLIAGVAPGKFAPDGKLTREQAAQLLARALKLKAGGITSPADAGQVSAAAKPAVQAVLEQGWMTSYNGNFSPKTTMPREQAAVIAVRVLYRAGIGKLGK
ncbi:S-layer homology domain-containing protein [Cohnella sp. CFH 77786]|uniref:S-layer homology domain-containing protein n=1 Tax=Cohnella sp. CFH 77786 TaxID=2662265 RepID=UPI001C60D23B|nr:S-layer homology domain-containing protein [Cohnella sp. CFH 77786]